MKRIFLLLAGICFLYYPGFSQYDPESPFHRFEITPMAGYQFGGKMEFFQGRLKVLDNADYGSSLDILLGNIATLEIMYSRMDSRASWRPYHAYQIDFPSRTCPVAFNYFQLGVLKEAIIRQIRPYGLFSMGATWMELRDTDRDDTWNFSVTVGAGVKIFFSRVIGIRLQGRLMLPMYFSGSNLFCGIGIPGSAGLTVNSNSTYIQGDLDAGLILAFGK